MVNISLILFINHAPSNTFWVI